MIPFLLEVCGVKCELFEQYKKLEDMSEIVSILKDYEDSDILVDLSDKLFDKIWNHFPKIFKILVKTNRKVKTILFKIEFKYNILRIFKIINKRYKIIKIQTLI